MFIHLDLFYSWQAQIYYYCKYSAVTMPLLLYMHCVAQIIIQECNLYWLFLRFCSIIFCGKDNFEFLPFFQALDVFVLSDPDVGKLTDLGNFVCRNL